MKTIRWASLLLLVFTLILGGTAMAKEGKTHKLEASTQTVHTGFFDSTIPPVLTIESGDTVMMNSMMLMDGQLRCGMTLEELLAKRGEYVERKVGPHTLTGPIFVKGAEPGDILEIRIKKLVPAKCGVNYHLPGKMNIGGLPEDFPAGQFKTLKLDVKNMKTTFAPGIEIPLKPFFGVMGLPPNREKKGRRLSRIILAGIWIIRSWSLEPPSICRSMFPAASFLQETPMPFKGTAR